MRCVEQYTHSVAQGTLNTQCKEVCLGKRKVRHSKQHKNTLTVHR